MGNCPVVMGNGPRPLTPETVGPVRTGVRVAVMTFETLATHLVLRPERRFLPCYLSSFVLSSRRTKCPPENKIDCFDIYEIN
jgi:hypothetical protein